MRDNNRNECHTGGGAETLIHDHNLSQNSADVLFNNQTKLCSSCNDCQEGWVYSTGMF